MYFEDIDLGYRVGRAGYRNVDEPADAVGHSGAHSTTTESAQMIPAHRANAWLFLKKKYSGWRLFPVRAAVVAVELGVRSAMLQRSAGA